MLILLLSLLDHHCSHTYFSKKVLCVNLFFRVHFCCAQPRTVRWAECLAYLCGIVTTQGHELHCHSKCLMSKALQTAHSRKFPLRQAEPSCTLSPHYLEDLDHGPSLTQVVIIPPSASFSLRTILKSTSLSFIQSTSISLTSGRKSWLFS